MILLPLALLLAGPAASQTSQRERMLREGNWNQRIHAVTLLGSQGPGALPLLAYAAHDADWQVRMTAAHEMGRVGRPALGALETVLREEPCRHVRLTAMHWLGSLGPEAADALRRALGDESAMVRMMGRYWLKKDDASAGSDKADAPAAANEDLKACVSSPQAGRAPWAGARSPEAPGPDLPPLDETVVTKAPDAPKSTAPAPGAVPAPSEDAALKLGQARIKELDDLLAPSTKEPERLPAPPPGFGERAAPSSSSAAYASVGREKAPVSSVKRPKDPATPELLPPGAPGTSERPAPRTSEAEIVADAGPGKMASDPLPALLAYLKSADAATRARAADELGRRGTPAAVEGLTAALKDRVPRVRASAALALGNTGAAADAAVPALVAALKKGPEEVTWSAALALGRIGTPRARRAFARHSRESAGELARPKP